MLVCLDPVETIMCMRKGVDLQMKYDRSNEELELIKDEMKSFRKSIRKRLQQLSIPVEESWYKCKYSDTNQINNMKEIITDKYM